MESSSITSRPSSAGRSAEEDALYQVLSIEREAQAIIAEAQDQAQRIVADAREQARRLEEQADKESRDEANRLAQETQRDAQEQATQWIAAVEADMHAWEANAGRHITQAVARVMAVVALVGQERDGAGI